MNRPEAVDQDELILQDSEQRTIAAHIQIPIRYLFNGPVDESLIRNMYRKIGVI